MQPRAAPAGGRQGARPRGPGCAQEPAREPRPPPRWALTEKELRAMSPAQRHRHLLFGDLLEDVSGAYSSVFPRDSMELGYRVADPRSWTQPLELLAQRQDLLFGVLKAAEARGRVRALRLRHARLRAEEIALLVQRQKTALAAIRLELFLPPRLKPTRIPDPLNRQERRRVEAILQEPLD
ncbi:protein LKAAEAR1 isoform X2 [Sorex araneus]|uniref:protein LKAAEAR1 isoform X2 n=1 Tax=Sorex araneus TaxID=42254 RepID=UPI002433FDF6|nr:protein LKAAEAR1 isoform X2 [Sorex araneus]